MADLPPPSQASDTTRRDATARWAKEGKLPFLRTLGGHRRYPAAEIRQLAEELQVRPTA
jgi:predicted site-specific integrase-resolvase